MNQITLGELLPQMEAQATRMSVKNPTRRLLWIAAQMLTQMAMELTARREAEAKAQPDQPRIILPLTAEAETDRGLARY